MGIAYNSRIANDGLVLLLDAGNAKSYKKYSLGWSGSYGSAINSFDGSTSTFTGSIGGNFSATYTFQEPLKTSSIVRINATLGASIAQVGSAINIVRVNGVDVTQKLKDAGAYAPASQWIDVTTEVGGVFKTIQINGTTGVSNPGISAIEIGGQILNENVWTDLSGNGNNAIKKGTSSYSIWNSSGYFEHRPINYFGATDSISSAPDAGGSWWEIPHSSSVSPTNGWSVGGWLKVIGDQTDNGTGWFHKQGTGDERGIHLEPIGGSFRANASDGWSQINYDIDNSGIWANYFFVFNQTSGVYGTNPGSLKFYINQVQVTEDTSFTPKIDTTSPIYLGRRNGHLRHFLYGDISNYQYYNRALTAAEVQQNFNALRGRFGI